MSANVTSPKDATAPPVASPPVPKRITNAQTVCNERNEKKEKIRPFHEIRFGSVRAAIWKNKTAQGFTRHSATVSKLFFDQKDIDPLLAHGCF